MSVMEFVERNNHEKQSFNYYVQILINMFKRTITSFISIIPCYYYNDVQNAQTRWASPTH